VPRADTLHESLQVIFGSISKFQWREFLMGTLMILWLVGLRFVSRRVPKLSFLAALGPISACVIGIVVVVAAKPGKLIKIVATIPAGMPPVTVGRWAPIDGVGALMALALVVMVVDLLESTSIARALARKNGYHLNYNQEIVGLGLANFAGAAFSSYTTTGSFSRSAVNNSSGARTQLAGFVTSIVVMFVLLFLTPVFAKLPYNTIAAIIIVGVTQLIEFEMAYYLFRTHLRDFFMWLAAFIGTLFLGAELGLAISIGLALGIVILESAFPHTAVLGRVERTTVYRNVEQYPNAETTPGVLAARLDAPVYFANVRHISEKLEEYEADAAAAAGACDVEFVILEMTPVPHIDAMGAAWLEELWAAYQARGVQLVLSNPSARVLRVLSRSGFIEKLGREWVFVRVHDAVTYCKAHTRVALDGGGKPAVSPDGAVGAAPAHGSGDASVSPGAGATKQRSFSVRG
jgi:sulfate transporter 4